jgi:hypothetical protein
VEENVQACPLHAWCRGTATVNVRYVTWLQGTLAFQNMAAEVRAQQRAAHLEAAADGEAGDAAKL